MKKAMKGSMGVLFSIAMILFLALGTPYAADMKATKDSEMMKKEAQPMTESGEKMMKKDKGMMEKDEMVVKEGKTMDKGKMMKPEGQMKEEVDKSKGMK